MGVPLNLKDIQSGFFSAATFNSNNTLIEQALAKTLNRTSNASDNAMEVDLDMGLNSIFNVKTNLNEPTSLLTLEDADSRYVNTDGDTLIGDLNAGGFNITNLGIPTGPNDAARLSDVGPDSAANLRIELASNTSGEGSDLVAYTGTGETVTEALDSRSKTVESIAAMELIDSPADGQRVFVSSYYAGGSLGGGLFTYKESSADTVDDVSVFSSTGAGRWLREKKEVYTVYDAGIQDDRNADSAAKLSALFAFANGALIIGDNIETKALSDIETENLNFFARGFTIYTDFSVIVQKAGAREFLGELSTAEGLGSRSLGFSGTLPAENDVIAIVNEQDFSLNSARFNYVDGEFNTVLSTGLDSISVANPIRSSYPVTDTKIYRVNTSEFYSEQLNIVPDTGSTSAVASLWVLNAKGGRLVGSYVRGGERAALRLDGCIGFEVTDSNGINTAPTTTGVQYGLSVINSVNVKVNGGYYYGTRHGIATGGSGKWVPVINFHAKKCVIASTESHGADMHGNTIDGLYEDCTIFNGAYVGGLNPRIRGGKIYKGSTTLPVSPTELIGGDFEVSGCEIYASGSPNGFVGGFTSALVAGTYEKVNYIIDDLKLYHNGTYSSSTGFFNLFAFAQGTSARVSNIDISNVSSSATEFLQVFGTVDSGTVRLFMDNCPAYPEQVSWVAFSGVDPATDMLALTVPSSLVVGTLNYTAGGTFAAVNLPEHKRAYGGVNPPVRLSFEGGDGQALIGIRQGFSGVYSVAAMSVAGFSATGSVNIRAEVGGKVI